MAGIIRREFRAYSASNLVDDVNGEGNQENFLYLAIGRSAVWTDENIPPTPTTKDSDMIEFWNNIEGMVRITPQQAALVVPRKNWTAGTIYQTFDTSKTDDLAFADNFYVKNSLDQVYMVTTAIGSSAVTEPTGTNDVTVDGVYYKFMYTISPADADRFKTDNWIPVNFESAALGGTLQVGETSANLFFGARDVMFYGTVNNDGVVINNTIKYRQVALIRNPILDDGAGTIASGSEYGKVSGAGFVTTPTGISNSIIRNSGELMYMENKLAIQRRADQIENIRLIVEY